MGNIVIYIGRKRLPYAYQQVQILQLLNGCLCFNLGDESRVVCFKECVRYTHKLAKGSLLVWTSYKTVRMHIYFLALSSSGCIFYKTHFRREASIMHSLYRLIKICMFDIMITVFCRLYVCQCCYITHIFIQSPSITCILIIVCPMLNLYPK